MLLEEEDIFFIGDPVNKGLVGWLFWVLRPFETAFQSISGRLPERERKRREKTEESKNVQTTPSRTYCKRNRPLPYYHPSCRTPRHWKFTQDHRTTRPPPCKREETEYGVNSSPDCVPIHLKSGPVVIKNFSCSTQQSMNFSQLKHMKLSTIVGIFIFIRKENFTLSITEQGNNCT